MSVAPTYKRSSSHKHQDIEYHTSQIPDTRMVSLKASALLGGSSTEDGAGDVDSDDENKGTWLEQETRWITDGKTNLTKRIRFKVNLGDSKSQSKQRLRRLLCCDSDSESESDEVVIEDNEDAASSDEDASPAHAEHETHWYSDGNVMLQIDNVCFRLYQGRLSARSTWFKSLFDRHYTVLEGDDFDDQEEIDRVVETCVVVDGCVLFVLDDLDSELTPEIFATFLTAIDDGMDHLASKPTFTELHNILKVALAFRFSSYAESIVYAIGDLFAAEPAEVDSDALMYVVDAVKLFRDYGHLYPELSNIPRCAFYLLARDNPPAPKDLLKDVNMADLCSSDLILLMDLQKQLLLSWEGVTELVQAITDTNEEAQLCVLNTITQMRKRHPFDPITGIDNIIEQDWSTESCYKIRNILVEKLEEERTKIWEDINVWLKID